MERCTYCASATIAWILARTLSVRKKLGRRSSPAMDGTLSPSNRTGLKRGTTKMAHRPGWRQSDGSRWSDSSSREQSRCVTRDVLGRTINTHTRKSVRHASLWMLCLYHFESRIRTPRRTKMTPMKATPKQKPQPVSWTTSTVRYIA
jgi:hypothetical protein